MATDLEGLAIYPVSDLFQAADFPLADLVPSDALAQVFGKIFYTEARSYAVGGGYAFDVTLAFEGELALTPPGTEAVALVLGETSGGWTLLETVLVIGPEPSFSLVDVPVSLRFDPKVLKDVATGGPASLSIAVTLEISTDGLSLTTNNTLNLPECEIAGSGVKISAAGITWNFTNGATIPEAEAAGLVGEFIGVAFKQVTLTLPPAVAGAPTLSLDSCCIGTGGFTGGVSVSFAAPPTCQLGGFSIEIDRVSVRFERSRLVLGEIEALMRGVSFFDSDVAVDVQLQADGTFTLAIAAAPNRQVSGNASVANGLVTLTKPGIISMTLTAVALKVGPSGGALTLSGSIQPLIQLPGGAKLPGFKVQALTITSTGEVSVEGGWINLPTALRVALGPFAMTLSQVGLGTDPNGERWVSFSGSLSLVQGVPITAAVDGLTIRWDDTGFKGVSLSGVALTLKIPNVLFLDASVRFIADGNRFEGAGTLQLTSINLTVSVRVVIGSRADYTYMYLYLLVQPPVGVPIFQTGLAFYSLEALYARNMEPDRSGTELWYRDWYRRPLIGSVDQTKWKDELGSMAFGAGVTIGSFPDKGYAVSVRGMLILVIPGPILMLDVKANLIKDPGALALPQSQALFSSLVVFDGRQGTIEVGIEPHYMFPDNGELIDVSGIVEAFYSFNDPSAWYLYLGRREREKRIRATILTIFEANMYLMLNNQGMQLGGFIGYDKSINAGPVKVTLQAYIEGDAEVSWRPKQFRGRMHLQGAVGLYVCGVGLGASVSAAVEAQAPQPFVIDASLEIKVDLPWPLPDLDAAAKLHWEKPGPPRITAPLQSIGIVHPLTTAAWALDVEPVVPLDGRPALVFERAVDDPNTVGPNQTPADEIVVGEYRLKSALAGVELLVEDPAGNWMPYSAPNNTTRPLFGAWQAQAGANEAGNRRLLLWSRTPYEWAKALTETAIEQLEEAEDFSPCDPPSKPFLVDFDDHPNEELLGGVPHEYEGITWIAGGHGALVVEVVNVVPTIAPPLPTPYYRCLFLPDQFSFVAVGGGPATQPSAGGPAARPLPPLTIVFADDVDELSILCLAMAGLSLVAYDAAGVEVGRVATAQGTGNPYPGGAFQPTQLRLASGRIRSIELTCGYRAAVVALVSRPVSSATEQAARRSAMTQMLDRYKREAPVLEPHRRYKLKVTSTVTETSGQSLEGADIESPAGVVGQAVGSVCTFRQEFTFRTEGPPGDAQLSPMGADVDAGADLDTLEPYTREIVPPRGALAVYRDYDLRVAFNADYVDHMYAANGQTLEIQLRSDAGETLTLANTTAPGREIVLQREERSWLGTLERSTCQLTMLSSNIVTETVVSANLGAASLASRARYDARLAATPGGAREGTRPLLQWSFISSAFKNFVDHFSLNGRVRPAELQGVAGAAWAERAGAAIAAQDPWATTEAAERRRRRDIEVEAYERLIVAVSLESALPQTVELTAVQGGGATWAFLLRSPEPFDWSRVSLRMKRLGVRSSEMVPNPVGCLLFFVQRFFPPRIPLPEDIPVALRVIRDADGTSALLFALGAVGPETHPTGDYTLEGTYRRDLGVGTLLLTEHGSSADEVAAMRWTLPLH